MPSRLLDRWALSSQERPGLEMSIEGQGMWVELKAKKLDQSHDGKWMERSTRDQTGATPRKSSQGKSTGKQRRTRGWPVKSQENQEGQILLQRGAWKWGDSQKEACLSFKSSFPKRLSLDTVGKDPIERRNGCYRKMASRKCKDLKEEKIISTDGRAWEHMEPQ